MSNKGITSMKSLCYIRLTAIFIKEEDGRWTAECKELGTGTFGDSFEDVKMQLEEAIELHLNTLEELGEREQFFQDNNIKIYPAKPTEKRIRKNIPVNPNVFMNTFDYPVHAHAC